MHLFSTNIQSIFGPCYNWNYTSYSSLHYLLIQFMPGKEPKFRFSVHFEYFGICLKNNGTCIEHKAFEEFSCECPQHYGGRRCEIELCKEMNCKNGGFCSVYIIMGKEKKYVTAENKTESIFLSEILVKYLQYAVAIPVKMVVLVIWQQSMIL